MDRIARKSHRLFLFLAASLAIATCAFGVLSPTPAAAATTARTANSLIESIGVNVHLGYTNPSPYGNFPKVQKALDELGVKYIRDGVGLGRPDVYSKYRTLAAEGIKLDFIVGDPLQRWGSGNVEEQLSMVNKEFPTALASLEAPNEYDISGDPNWLPDLTSYVQQMYLGIKARPALAATPIVGPTIVRNEARALVGSMSAWTTYGNEHPYPGGEMPDLESHTKSEFALAAQLTGSQPVQATETGYTNAVNTTEGHRPASERAAGIYTPRLFLDNFRNGVARSYDYELVDEGNDTSKTDIEQNFGLLHNDFTPKPSYTSLKNMISILADPGAEFTPSKLSYSLAGAPSSARSVLLQKRDGTFYLAVWNAVSVWNQTNCTTLNPSSPQVKLNLEQPIASAEAFYPNESATSVSSVSNPSSISFALTPGVTIFRLVPGETTSKPVEAVLEPSPEASPEAPSAPTPSAGQEKSSTPSVPTTVPVPVSVPATGTPTSAPTVTGISKSEIQAAVNPAKKRKIIRSVRSGCVRGCPLHGAELTKARRLLKATGATPGAATASSLASLPDEGVATWLRGRAERLADGKQPNHDVMVRCLTIEIVLEVAGDPATTADQTNL